MFQDGYRDTDSYHEQCELSYCKDIVKNQHLYDDDPSELAFAKARLHSYGVLLEDSDEDTEVNFELYTFLVTVIMLKNTIFQDICFDMSAADLNVCNK